MTKAIKFQINILVKDPATIEALDGLKARSMNRASTIRQLLREFKNNDFRFRSEESDDK